jgi:hypothetical protein
MQLVTMVQSIQGDLSNRMKGLVNEQQLPRMVTTLTSIQELLRQMPEGHWDAPLEGRKPQHFCEVPHTAVCGYDLAQGDSYVRFHNETTNCFAHVSCETCRQWIRDNRFIPSGFPDPPEWSVNEP